MSCTGSCRVSSKANDTAWVSEESYFNSALSLADKGECVWELSLAHPRGSTSLRVEPVCLPCLPTCLWDPTLACPLPGPYVLVSLPGRL